MDLDKLLGKPSLPEGEPDVRAEFRARYGFVPRPLRRDTYTPGGYEARLRKALDTADIRGMAPLGRFNGVILD